MTEQNNSPLPYIEDMKGAAEAASTLNSKFSKVLDYILKKPAEFAADVAAALLSEPVRKAVLRRESSSTPK